MRAERQQEIGVIHLKKGEKWSVLWEGVPTSVRCDSECEVFSLK